MIRSGLRRLRVRLAPVPGQALGLTALIAVLAAVLVSAPLMVASAEEGAWQQQRARLAASAVGQTLVSSTAASDGRWPQRITRIAEFDDAIVDATDRAGLEQPITFTALHDPALAPGGLVQLASRTGVENHVEIVDGEYSDAAVLVPELVAEKAGVGPGDTLVLGGRNGVTSAAVPISGVYAEPIEPLPPYWEGYSFFFVPYWDDETGNLVDPPPALLAPRDLALATTAALEEDLDLEWFVPLEEGIGATEARTAAGRLDRLQALLVDPDSKLSRMITEEGYARPHARTALPDVLQIVDRTVELLEPPVRAVGIGGGAAALVLVGAWAGQRVRRREDELRSLVVRGLSPARGAGDAVREALLPVLAGLTVGGAIGWLLIDTLGPAADLPAGALPRSLLVLAAGGGAALAVVASVTAVLVGRLDAVGRGQAAHLLGRVPWLALTTVLAALAVVPLVAGGPAEEGGRIGVLPLMAPLLVTVVAAGLLTASLPRIGSRADARLRRLPPGPFLAVRRVLASSATARLVVVTTALALGLVVYAGALADGTARTIEAKAAVATGSDVVVPLPAVRAVDGPLPAGATVVGTENDVRLSPGEVAVDVVAVHPEQVADVVRWNDQLADRPLDELMGALRAYDGDRVPVILAGPGPDVEATGTELTLDFRYYAMPVEVVATADAFPGQNSRDPLVVTDWDRYAAALEAENRDPDLVVHREVWARGQVGEVLDALATAGVAPSALDDVRTAEEFAARPELQAQTWALSYLRAVALAAGVLGLVGVAMHALAQQRRRTVATLLLTRMGMSRRASDTAAGLEIGLLTGTAAAAAVAVALPAAALVLHLLDPVPSLRPDAVFAVPWSSLAAVAAGVVLVTGAGALLVGRTARRATGGQVMRDAS
jgi:hypothetical protein